MPLSTLQAPPHDDACKTQGQDGVAFSFSAELFHPLQHAGLARRTPRLLDALVEHCELDGGTTLDGRWTNWPDLRGVKRVRAATWVTEVTSYMRVTRLPDLAG